MAKQSNDTRIDKAQALLERFCGGDGGRSTALSFCAHKGAHYTSVTLHANGDVARPVASVIKVAQVMALYDLALAGTIDLDEQVPLKALGDTRYCSIMKAFDDGRSLSLRELAALALITSDNPAAVLIDEQVGREAVRDVLMRAGVADARAKMPAGFSEDDLGPRNRANELTALEVLNLFELLGLERRYGPIILALENNLRNARIPALLPDDAVIAHKTGSLEGVVNDAGVVRLGMESFVVAFLCDGQGDPAATEREIAACSEALFEMVLGQD